MDESDNTGKFSGWRAFPDPRNEGMLVAPFGPGCYELRHGDTGQLVLFGKSSHVAWRMTSLLPKPHGQGTRDHAAKRDHVLHNLAVIEYRTLACGTKEEATVAEKILAANRDAYLFKT